MRLETISDYLSRSKHKQKFCGIYRNSVIVLNRSSEWFPLLGLKTNARFSRSIGRGTAWLELVFRCSNENHLLLLFRRTTEFSEISQRICLFKQDFNVFVRNRQWKITLPVQNYHEIPRNSTNNLFIWKKKYSFLVLFCGGNWAWNPLNSGQNYFLD